MRERVEQMAERLATHGPGDAYGRVSRTVSAGFRSNVIDRVRFGSSNGAGARVAVDGRLGFAGGTDHTEPAIIVADALEAARFGPEVGNLQLGSPSDAAQEDDQASEETAALDVATLIRIAADLLDRVRSARGDVLVDVSASLSESRSVLASSNGLRHSRRRTVFGLSVSVKRNRDGDLLTLSESASARDHRDDRVSPERLCKAILGRLVRCDRAARLESGSYPVVFVGSGVSGLFYPLMLGLQGENLARGTSPLSNDRSALLAPELTLYSDPALGGLDTAAMRDGDGFPAGRVDLIREGRVVGGLFDAVTAARFRRRFPEQAGFARPGSARRGGVGGSTSPGPSGLALAPGTLTHPLEGIRRGLLVESLLGVRMGNPIGGEFSNSVHIGHLIEDGEIVGRVKDVMVAGNVYAALANLDGVASRAEWVDEDELLPPVRVASMRVTGKG